MPSTLRNLKLPSTSVNPALPSTSVDPTLLSTSTGPTLPRQVRCVTFRLLLPLGDKCRKVGIVKESLSWDLEQQRQEVLWFHSKVVVTIPTTKGGVMYLEDVELAQFQQDHKYDTYYWFLE